MHACTTASAAVLTLLVVQGVAMGQSPARTKPAAPAKSAQVDRAPAVRPLQPAPSVDQQMMALERHAKFGMICYTGGLKGDLAGTANKIPEVALSLAGAK